MSGSKKSSSLISKNKLADSHAGLRFVRRFQDSLARTGILPRGAKIIVAVSGGPDSMALLTLLARLREKHQYELHIVHVNYELRGKDADRDENLVKKTVDGYPLPITAFRPKVKPRKNIEEALRLVRYRFFERLRKRLDFDVIVTAHTMNDVAETVLMNLIRGAGLTGLSPFREGNTNSLVRPLLPFTRQEIEAFLANESLPSRLDRSNRSFRFTRNRIRHTVLPLLETFNPSIIQTLAATAKRLSVSADATISYPIVMENIQAKRPVYTFSRPDFCGLTHPHQERFLYTFFQMVSTRKQAPSHRFIQEVARVIRSARPGTKTLRSGPLNCRCFRDRVETTLN